MLKFLFFSALVLAAVTVGAPIFFPLLIVFSLIWLITLPFRLVFGVVGGLIHLVFGIVGAVIGVLFAPIVLLIMGVAVLGALAVGAVALLAPLLPIAIVVLIIWGLLRLMRPSPYTA